jgi:hypothetical protein
MLRSGRVPRLVHSGHHLRHRTDKIPVQIDEDDDGENVIVSS